MADQLLVNIIRVPAVGNLAPGAIVTLPHGLKYAGNGVVPNQYLPWQATNIIVNFATDTDVTFQNTDAAPTFAFFRVEYDHSIHAIGTGPLYWRGVSATTPAGAVATYGSYSNTDGPTTIPVVPLNPLAVTFDTVEGQNGVSLVGGSKLTVGSDGVYEFSFSPQLVHSGGSASTISMWLRLNGLSPIPRTNSDIRLANNNDTIFLYIAVIVSLSAGDYVEWLMSSSGGTATVFNSLAGTGGAGPNDRPLAPALIASVKRLGS